MEIAKGSLGPEAIYFVGTRDGKAAASIDYKGADGEAHISGTYDLDKLLDKVGQKVKDIIPGTAEEPFVDLVVGAIKNVLK